MVGLMLTTYNQLEDTKKTLASLEQNTEISFHLVIVDNHSADETISFIKNKGYPVIENVQPVSLTVALNQGMRFLLSNPDIQYIGWIHNDMTFYPHWLTRLVDHLQRNPFIGKLAPASLHLFGNDDQIFAEEFMRQHKEINYPGNACPWVMPRGVIEQVGFFDEQFIQCGGYEDWDYNNRILKEGYQVMITKGSAVWHPSMGTRKNHDESESSHHNASLYFQKWGTTHPMV